MIQGGHIQDLYHYALAIQGNQMSTFRSDTLGRRLACYENLCGLTRRMVDAVERVDDGSLISIVSELNRQVVDADLLTSEKEMIRIGREAERSANVLGGYLKIDPVSGNSLSHDPAAI
jgi:hypothetical protein